MAKKPKLRISRPIQVKDGYIIQVREGISPIAPIAWELKFPTKIEADKSYRHLKIENGEWI